MADDLAGVFVLSDGFNVNGSALVAGITGVIGSDIPLTGGLAGDGADFKETLVGGDCAPQPRMVAAIGFYGSAIRVGHGSAGGWDVFGPRRRVTKSAGNVLFELDGEPALDLYERYLGPEDSKGLPGSALLFPIQVYDAARPDSAVVRTVLAVDRDAGSMTFAGDVPEGWTAQLMRGSFDRLAAGAADAARQARGGLNGAAGDQQFSILVSCIGRRLLMGQRTTDETEAAGSELGAGSAAWLLLLWRDFPARQVRHVRAAQPDHDGDFVRRGRDLTVHRLYRPADRKSDRRRRHARRRQIQRAGRRRL